MAERSAQRGSCFFAVFWSRPPFGCARCRCWLLSFAVCQSLGAFGSITVRAANSRWNVSLSLSLAVSRCVAVEASRQSTVGYFTTTASKAKIPTNHKMQGPFFVFVSVCVCASFAAALFGCCVGRRIDSLSLRIDRRCSFLDSVFARRGKTHTVPVPLLRTRSEQKRGKNRTVRDRTSCCEPWPNNFSPSHLPSRGQKRETLTTPTTPTTPTSAHTYTRTRGERETEDSDSRVCAEWD